MAEDSALVLVGPDDSVDSIIKKVRDAGTRSVELLVAEGAPALQVIGGLSRLRTSAAEQDISLLLITSDEKTLNAARLCQVDAVSVQGVPVMAPPRAAESINPYSTRPLPAVDLGSDDELLRALDADTRPGRRPPVGNTPSHSDDEILAALDDLSGFNSGVADQPRSGRDRQTPVFRDADDSYAAELDAWGDLSAGDDEYDASPRQQSVAPPPYEQPTRRVRPEDIALTEDDLRGNERREAARERDRARRPPARRAPAPLVDDTPRRRRSVYEDEGYEAAPTRRASSPLFTWVPVLLILLLVAAGGYWLYSNRATVIVRPPVPATEIVPFTDLAMPLSDTPVEATSPAVQAQAVQVEGVEYSATGTVSGETVAPRNSAKGVVTVLNSGNTPVDLPQGTEFIAANSQGQEVRFVTDAGVAVPPATTSDTGAQIVTQRGQAQVNVTARQPGSASNVDANTIRQIAFPGQAPVPASGGALLVQNGPLTGGDEQPVRIVTDQDVQLVLQQALTGLYEQGLKSLQEQANGAGGSWRLEQTTVAPTPEELSKVGEGQVFELVINPQVGTEVSAENPTFTVTVRAAFNALAVPENRPLPDQLATAVPQQLLQAGTLKPGLAPTITGWRWDGSRLLVSGELKPTETTATIDAATRAAILDQLRGKSRAEATTILDGYKERGVIGDYTLPDRDPLPSLSFQLDLQVE